MQRKKIAFIHPGSAYLPELEAYGAFFTKHGFEVDIFTKKDSIILSNYDIEWHLMGTDHSPKVPGRLKIHEYTSLSLPPLAKCKNQVKTWISTTPDFRIFLNEAIQRELHFFDGAPYLYRSAGIGSHFFASNIQSTPIYDFVYLGAMHATRKMELLFNFFLAHFKSETFLIIGEAPFSLIKRFQSDQLHFIGKIPYINVPSYLKKATYGINYIPLRYPYTLQPSYKLLDYCASGLKVITTDYEWVNQFEQKQGGHFFKIKKDWSNFHPDSISSFDYRTPDVADLQWDGIINASNIMNFIQQYFVKV